MISHAEALMAIKLFMDVSTFETQRSGMSVLYVNASSIPFPCTFPVDESLQEQGRRLYRPYKTQYGIADTLVGAPLRKHRRPGPDALNLVKLH
jgi:hypothetical protein